MRTLVIVSVAALLSACSSQMLETHGDQIQLFKTGQEKPGRGGSLRYLANGLEFAKKARRADAEKQMARFCGGEYAITAEGPRSKFGASMPIPTASLEVDQYWYVAFDCR
jgi:hypothetical protein